MRPRRLLVVLLTVLGLCATGMAFAPASCWPPPQIKSLGVYATESGNPNIVRVIRTHQRLR